MEGLGGSLRKKFISVFIHSCRGTHTQDVWIMTFSGSVSVVKIPTHPTFHRSHGGRQGGGGEIALLKGSNASIFVVSVYLSYHNTSFAIFFLLRFVFDDHHSGQARKCSSRISITPCLPACHSLLSRRVFVFIKSVLLPSHLTSVPLTEK